MPSASQGVTAQQLTALSAPFPAEDIEWRVARAGTGSKGIWAKVLAYLTSRSIQQRLDDVVGPGNWKNEAPHASDWGPKAVAVTCGISIRIDGEWITKWDVAEPTNIEPAKGGFSGAMKRAGAQWGIGRYLYHLDEAYAEVSENGGKGWEFAKLPNGGGSYYWKAPSLPSWALPKEPEHEVTAKELAVLKKLWKEKFAADSRSVKDLQEGFAQFVASVVGEFPISDHVCWTKDAFKKCQDRIAATVDPNGISADVPFEGVK